MSDYNPTVDGSIENHGICIIGDIIRDTTSGTLKSGFLNEFDPDFGADILNVYAIFMDFDASAFSGTPDTLKIVLNVTSGDTSGIVIRGLPQPSTNYDNAGLYQAVIDAQGNEYANVLTTSAGLKTITLGGNAMTDFINNGKKLYIVIASWAKNLDSSNFVCDQYEYMGCDVDFDGIPDTGDDPDTCISNGGQPIYNYDNCVGGHFENTYSYAGGNNLAIDSNEGSVPPILRVQISVTTTTKTETGIARIQKLVTKVQTGIARIMGIVTRTETGVARIEQTASQTMTGVANITMRLPSPVSEGVFMLQLRNNSHVLTTKITNTKSKSFLPTHNVENTILEQSNINKTII